MGFFKGEYMEIVLATRNKNKVGEMRRILDDINVQIKTLDDFPSCPEVEEDRDTFEGNAVKKALEISKCSGQIAVSDDSGLEVYELGGAPGVMSARYAGKNSGDAANLEKLLSEMKGFPDEKRGARFVCCIALAFPDGKVVTFQGFVEGRIGKVSTGSKGFGYDPVFYPSGYQKTFAEMTAGEKDALSHRGAALKKFKDHLKTLSNSKYK